MTDAYKKNLYLYLLQSNFNGSNILGTIKICSRQGYFEPFRVDYSAMSGDIIGMSFRCLFDFLQ